MSGALKLSWPVRTRAELQLRTYCDRRVPRHAVRQVRMEFEIRGMSAMIVERRVPWRPTSPAEEWTRLPIAKFRFDLESTCRGPRGTGAPRATRDGAWRTSFPMWLRSSMVPFAPSSAYVLLPRRSSR